MSNNLIYALIGEAELPQIDQLWADGVSDEVFLPFFACFLANLADDEMNAWYKNFITATETAYHTALETGSQLVGGDIYWHNPLHIKLAERIAQATFVDKALIKTAFPLATHAGYEHLSEQADMFGMSVLDFAKAKLHGIAPSLPAWAEEAVAPAVLSQVSVASLVNKTLQNDLGIELNNLDDDVFLVEHLDAPLEDKKPSDEIELSADDFIIDTSLDLAPPVSKQELDDVALGLDDDIMLVIEDELLDNTPKPAQANAPLALDKNPPVATPPNPTPTPIANPIATDVPLFELDDALPSLSTPAPRQAELIQPHQDDSSLFDHSLDVPSSRQNEPAPFPTAPSLFETQGNSSFDSVFDNEPADNESPYHNDNDNGNDDNDNDDDDNHPIARIPTRSRPLVTDFNEIDLGAKPKKKSNNALKIAIPAVLLLAIAGGGGFWYYQNMMNTPEPVVAVVDEPAPVAPVAPLPVQSLPPSHLSLTVDDAGNLYACRAELGNDQLMQQVFGLLQANFSNTICAIDVNTGVSQTMAGIDKLTSVIGMLKVSPFASLELAGDTLWIHSPNPDEITRLVNDMGALMGGAVKVMARPALNAPAEIDASLTKAGVVLSNLPQNADDHSLARAMSIPIVDMSSGALPEANRLFLVQAGERLKAKSSTRLIIAVHSDDTGDKAQARKQTQIYANAIKKAMMDMGVKDFQLIAKGVGSDFPAMDNLTELGRFKNRRVEFLVYDDATFNALNAPAVPAPTAPAEQPAEVAPVVAEQPQANTAVMPPAPNLEEMPMPTQPALTVSNGQIVEQAPPANAKFAPIQAPEPVAPSTDIDDDLLKPLSSESGKGHSSQVH